MAKVKKITSNLTDIYIDEESGEYMVDVETLDDHYDWVGITLIVSPFKQMDYEHHDSRELCEMVLCFNADDYEDKYLVRFW